MTPNAQHKRAERERRKAAGEVRCEVHVSADDHAWLKQVALDNEASVADIIQWCVETMRTDCHS